MPLLSHRNPSYRRHKPSGQAVVSLDGKDTYLGVWKSKASKVEYDRIVGEWLANGRCLTSSSANLDLTIGELIERFLDHAETYYRHPDGTCTAEVAMFKLALSVLYRLYGQTLARAFGPLALEAVRNEMIAKSWKRRSINSQIGRLKRVFKWGVAKQLVPVTVHQALTTLAGLQAGRSKAQESDSIRPVPQPTIDATLPFLSRTVTALVKLQLVTAARPGELVLARTGDIDRSGKIWVFKPHHHKTAYKGHSREIYLGPQAQEIVTPFLKMDPTAYIFSPFDAEQERREARTLARKTPPGMGNCVGTNRKRRPKREPGERYTTGSYRRAIQRACDLAFPAPAELRTPDKVKEFKVWQSEHRWHPHQLRHSAATNLRKQFGIEAAQIFLGHATMDSTIVYAERDAAAARRVAEAVG